MNLEPQKFFIGLIDFFAILMPGALVAYLVKDHAGPLLLDQADLLSEAPAELIVRLDSAEVWMVFLFASYLLGHLAFLLGSKLDEWIYLPLRSLTDLGQIRRLAKGKSLRGRVWRALSRVVFGANADAAVVQAQNIKARALHGISAEGAINAFQWCKARLSKEHPEGLLAVKRFEANSKFFRTFVVVLAALAVAHVVSSQIIPALVCMGVLPFALWRYMDQRFKSTKQAYWFVIMLEGMKGEPGPAVSPHRRSDGLTHAGGVVFCRRKTTVEYLLVEASKDRAHWVLPKGQIEPGEGPRETAVREVREEAGYWARIVHWMEDVKTGGENDPNEVRFYLMEANKGGRHSNTDESWLAENRRHQWLTLAEALQRSSFEETKNLLKKAEALRRE